jgi:hypothetical protein
MASDRYAEFLPAISKWIQAILDGHAGKAKPVASLQFSRLPRYFSEQLLSTTSVVLIDRPPTRPPVYSSSTPAIGLSRLSPSHTSSSSPWSDRRTHKRPPLIPGCRR